MFAPYLGLVIGTIALAGIRETYFERFWWLALLAALAYLGVLSLKAAPCARRRKQTGADQDAVAAMTQALRAVRQLPRDASLAALRELLPRLHDVRIAGDSFSAAGRAELLESLRAVDAHAYVEAELARTTPKGHQADALSLLGWLTDERSLPAQASALRDLGDRDPDPDPDVRSWVAYLLGRSRSAHAGMWLESLAADPEPEVRASAAEALAEFPQTAVLESLLSDPHWLVRANAAKAIGDADFTRLAPHLTPHSAHRRWPPCCRCSRTMTSSLATRPRRF